MELLNEQEMLERNLLAQLIEKRKLAEIEALNQKTPISGKTYWKRKTNRITKSEATVTKRTRRTSSERQILAGENSAFKRKRAGANETENPG